MLEINGYEQDTRKDKPLFFFLTFYMASIWSKKTTLAG
jgi:hypothetical protein